MMLELLGEIAPSPGWTKPLPTSQGTSYLYPIFIILGFVVAIVGACMKMWKRYKISVEPFYWFILIGVPVSIFGANFGSCVLGSPAGKPWSEFFTSFGTGLAVEWGVLFCFAAGCIYFPLVLKANRYKVRDEFGPKPEVKKVSMWLYMDAILPCVLIAQCLGRWGNYFNQEVYGAKVTSESLSWFLHNCLPGMYIEGAWRQPLFFWEMLLNLGGFLLLYVGAEFLRVRKTGDMTAAYFVWYGIIRLCLEPLRESQYKSNATMIMSIIYVVGGVIFIVLNHAVLPLFRAKRNYGYYSYRPTIEGEILHCQKKITNLKGKIDNENKKLNLNSNNEYSDEIKQSIKSTQDKITYWEARLNSLNAQSKNTNLNTKIKIYYGRW